MHQRPKNVIIICRLQFSFVGGMPLINKKVEHCSTFAANRDNFWHKSINNCNNSAIKKIFNKIIVIKRTTNLYFKNSQDKEMIFLYFHEVQFCGSQSVEVTFIHRQQLKTRNVLRRGRSLWKTFRKLSLLFLRHFKSTSKRHNFQKAWHNICGNP